MRIILALIFFLTLSSCGGGDGTPYSQYGYEGRQKGQEKYMDKLSSRKFMTQQQSWDEKLESHKGHFNDILKRQYTDLANRLSQENQYTDATYFRRKGIEAGHADFDVFPENPERWRVKDENELEDLIKARLELIDALIGYTPVVEPVKSAKAIVSYDCWLQQSQTKLPRRTDCKQNFKNNYDAIAKVSDDIRDKDLAQINEKYNWVKLEKPKVVAAEGENNLYYVDPSLMKSGKAPAPKDATVKTETVTTTKKDMTYTPSGTVAKTTTTTSTAKKVEVTPVQAAAPAKTAAAKPAETLITDQSTDKTPDLVYVAYYDKKTETMIDTAKAELDKTAEQIKKNNPKSVSVNGHTDRSYDSSASLLTSKKRADEVRDYLVSKGIAKDIIRTYGFGKTDNLVQNNEGEEKPANNRVEVVFKGTAN